MSEQFELGAPASELYSELLRRPDATADDLAAVLGLGDFRLAADQLTQIGLLAPARDAPSGYRALSAGTALEALLAREEAELAAQQLRVERSRAMAVRLIAETASAQESVEELERISGIDAIRLRLRLLADATQHTVCTFSPGSPTAADLEASRLPNERLLARGVRVRTVYQDSVRTAALLSSHLDDLADRGAEVRTTPTLPLRMIIFDGETAVVPSAVGSARDGVVVHRSEGVVTALTALFEATWATAAPVAREPEPGPHGLTPTERATLAMLAAGQTDSYVASRLNVSDRTARRIAADVMAKLGAQSRFEAGVLAERSGWLTSIRDANPRPGAYPPAL